MIVTAREFTSAAEMMAAAAAVHRRCFDAPKVRRLAAPPAQVIQISRRRPSRVSDKPSWMLAPTMFEEHMFAFRTAMRIREMVASGEIEMVAFERRSISEIVNEVLKEHPKITIPMLKGVGRRKELVIARQTAMFEIRKQRPDMSFPMIGRWFGGRDHTTVLHAVTKIAALRGEA
jgi:hypothetical protein